MTPTEISYLTFGIVLLLALAFDLGLMSKKNVAITMKKALYQTFFWIDLSIAFCIFLWLEDGSTVATKFFTAYLMEWSLSIDNIFVFILIFTYLKVKESDTGRTLLIGILLAIVFRMVFIALGIELIERFHRLLYIFGAILLYTGIKLLIKKEDDEYNPGEIKLYSMIQKHLRFTNVEPRGRFTVKQNGKLYFTSLFLVILILAATDVIFALDSIPTVVMLIREGPNIPFSNNDILVIYSSNIFAVLGLRSLFFLLKGAVNHFNFLQQGIAAVLVFIGVKMLIEPFNIHISIYISLIVIVICLLSSIIYSIFHKRKIQKLQHSPVNLQ